MIDKLQHDNDYVSQVIHQTDKINEIIDVVNALSEPKATDAKPNELEGYE